jgi:hypothetical protein
VARASRPRFQGENCGRDAHIGLRTGLPEGFGKLCVGKCRVRPFCPFFIISIPVNRTQQVYSLRALGRDDLPPAFELAQTTWRHVRTVKHDFFAATGFYEDDGGRRVVLKVSRIADIAGIPMQWLGRCLCRREMRFYSRLSDLPNVPSLLGSVGRTGFVHAYVQGRPLSKDRPVPDGFFRQLFDLLRELHRRDIAYVDTNKPENILIGADGRPHLIDFQISWDLHGLGGWWFNRWVLKRLQAEDLYHIRKHHRRLRGDELSADDARGAAQVSPWIRAHRLVTKPFKQLRRRTLQRLRETGRLVPEGSK